MSKAIDKVVEQFFGEDIPAEITEQEALFFLASCPIPGWSELLVPAYMLSRAVGLPPYKALKVVIASLLKTILE